MSNSVKKSRTWRAGVAAVAAGTAAVALGGLTASGATPRAHAAAPHALSGGTGIFAEQPAVSPNYIFPIMPFAFFSVANISQFQYLMFRPLYWFGTGGPNYDAKLSLASQPVWSNNNTVATITLRHYMWSDGEQVTTQDVVFWLNLIKLEKLQWAAYFSGGLPDDIKSVKIDSPTKMTFTLSAPVNPHWYFYNEFAQITPFPMAWDVSAKGQASGSQACGKASFAAVTVKEVTGKSPSVQPVSAAAKSCVAVYDYLSTTAGYNPNNPKASNNAFTTYATNPLWQVVDGPWRLSYFDSTGKLIMVPNPDYSGPVKPKLAKFEELPYTSSTAEFNALVGGSVNVGYLPPEDVTAAVTRPKASGANNPRVGGSFSLAPWYPYGFNYMPLNFVSTGNGGTAGKMFSQLYFRQALQSLVDQPAIISKAWKGYAYPTYGPVPIDPPTFAAGANLHNVYPYNPSRAVSLLKSHGWTVNPNGVSVCATSSKCGVPKGTKAQFTIDYYNALPSAVQEWQLEQASFAQAGIKVSLVGGSFDTIIGNTAPCPAGCSWEAGWWGGGWTYAPDFYPSGEELYATGAGSNNGSWSDPTTDKLIKQTTFGKASLAQYSDYLARQLPVIWQPMQAFQLTEVKKGLQGVTPQNVYLQLTPENWHFTK